MHFAATTALEFLFKIQNSNPKYNKTLSYILFAHAKPLPCVL